MGAENGVPGEGFVYGDVEGVAGGEGLPAVRAGVRVGSGGGGRRDEGRGAEGGCGFWWRWGGVGGGRRTGGREAGEEVGQEEAGVAVGGEGEVVLGVLQALGELFGVELGGRKRFAVFGVLARGDVPVSFAEAVAEPVGVPGDANDDEVGVEGEAVVAIRLEGGLAGDGLAIELDDGVGGEGFEGVLSVEVVDTADGGLRAVDLAPA